MQPVSLGVKAIVLQDDHVLLVQHAYGSRVWDLPGGHVRRQETVEQALVREVREECGVHVRVGKLLNIYHNPHLHKHDHVAVFVCDVERTGADPRSAEIARFRSFPLDALPELSPPVARRLAELRQARPLAAVW